jgi:hypothetical protein
MYGNVHEGVVTSEILEHGQESRRLGCFHEGTANRTMHINKVLDKEKER